MDIFANISRWIDLHVVYKSVIRIAFNMCFFKK